MYIHNYYNNHRYTFEPGEKIEFSFLTYEINVLTFKLSWHFKVIKESNFIFMICNQNVGPPTYNPLKNLLILNKLK
jgi:hypothetical protein